MSLVKSSATVGSLTMLSRVFGYTRDLLIAARLGAGPVSDAFFVAFRLPNLFRALFAEGAFNAAFVPMFSKLKDKDESKKFAENIFSIMIIFLLGFTILAQIFMPVLVWVLASGFEEGSEKFEMAVSLTRITFFYLFFVSLVSLLGGVLNSLKKFAAFASAPVLMNFCMIGALLTYTESAEISVYALAWSVFAAGIVQFIWLYYFCVKNGYSLKFKIPKLSPKTREMFRKMLPVMIGAGVLQINLVINTQIASYLEDGAISILYYADRLSQLPLAIIGTAMGTVLLPTVSRNYGDKDYAQAARTQSRAFEFGWLLGIPCAVGMVIIAEPLIQVLFERDEFTSSDTANVSTALIAYAVGIPAFILVKIFIVPFYASGDTSTPVKIGIFCILVNLSTSLSLIYLADFSFLALAISTTISSWVNFLLLITILKLRGIYKLPSEKLRFAAKALIPAAIMGVAVYFSSCMFENIYISLLYSIFIGVLVYGLLVYALGIASLKTLTNR